jgi:hypothetical protein
MPWVGQNRMASAFIITTYTKIMSIEEPIKLLFLIQVSISLIK